MSERDVEVVRQSIDAYVRRDVEGMRAVMTPDVEVDWSAATSWVAGVYRGFDEVMRFYADFYAAFEEITLDVDSYVPALDSVLVDAVTRHRGRAGVQVSARTTLLFTVRDGRVSRIRLLQSPDEALGGTGSAG